MLPTEHLANINIHDWSRSMPSHLTWAGAHQAFVCAYAGLFRAHLQSAAGLLLLLTASAQMFGCSSFSRSSSGIRRDKQTEHFESEVQQQRRGSKVRNTCFLSIQRTFCYMSETCFYSSYHRLLRWNFSWPYISRICICKKYVYVKIKRWNGPCTTVQCYVMHWYSITLLTFWSCFCSINRQNGNS